MNKYEVMIIIKPDLTENDRKTLVNQLSEVITKHSGEILSANIWSEKKRLMFPIKKYSEGVFFHINFNLAPDKIRDIKHAYKLNEDVLRVLVTKPE